MVAAAAGALALGLGGAAAAHADPIVTTGSGSVVALTPTVDAFRAQLGTLNPNVGGQGPAGRREINWDGVPAGSASPTQLPFDFFNSNSPRGVLLTSVDGAPGRVLVSSTNAGSELFRDVDASYAGLFQAFSAQRILSSQNIPIGSNDPSIDVVFRVPGTGVAATTNAFGAVFTGVNAANRSFLQFFSADGRNLGSYAAPTGTLSFVGVRYDAGERIALVRVHPGDIRLGRGIAQSGTQDLVALDDFVYGEPQQLPVPAGAESFESGLGGFIPGRLAGASGDPTFAIAGDDAHTGASSAFVPNAGAITDLTLTSPAVAIRGGGPSTLTFFHRDSIEREFDGALVEVSTDGGVNWTEPTPAQWLENGPTQRIANGFSSPIATRVAFSGASAGWVRSVLDLSPYAGATIRYRFRFASDQSVGARGWYIDDVSVATPAAPVTPAPQPQPQPRPLPQPQPRSPSPGPGAGRLSSLSLSPRSFASGRSARIRYTLSAAASVSFTVTRSQAGRRVRGHCVVPAPRRGARCTKTTTVKRLSGRGTAGANTLALSLGRAAPGSYTLKASAGGASKSVTFTVTRASARRRAARR
ncbi:immune inhibitor A [Conexibacter sp. JD483]|uniref:immune inhibitor A domain-containing protein n=1 Tax=unclassified Conexibacter TaxID=2627773 RepID=UPI002722CBDC|nr:MULTISPECIES: immune inhibitor A domain-containing protein [unclassified Conexibacter]MDO8188985.1 immune inhibitor A [Conexibacter sp. CPCC 205706]MDO8201803.1 immune inhibitor A [Conexibacter sp. CPCC 205762]MDR9371508.1 immune inhibitor A [Conexibacter sp. JD483]